MSEYNMPTVILSAHLGHIGRIRGFVNAGQIITVNINQNYVLGIQSAPMNVSASKIPNVIARPISVSKGPTYTKMTKKLTN